MSSLALIRLNHFIPVTAVGSWSRILLILTLSCYSDIPLLYHLMVVLPPPSAPLDGWGGISFHLTIQDCITTKWFNPVRRVITFEDWRFWKITKDECILVFVILTYLKDNLVKRGKATFEPHESCRISCSC